MQEKSLADTEKNNYETPAEEAILKSVESDSDVLLNEPEKEAPSDLIKEMETRIQVLEEEKQQAYDGFLRKSAEFENYKKRKDRETEDFKKFAVERLIKELLPIIDNLERAIVSSREENVENQSLIEGVDLTLKEILKIFEKFHITPIETRDQPFNPAFHQAVMQEETDVHPDGTIIRELQKGYLMHDRLIRPAMVVVAKA